MPYSTENTFTGDGSTTDFTITFPFLEAGDIKARVDGTTTTAFSVTGTTISFTTAPANTKAIVVYRDTDIDKTKVTFQTGASVRAQDLNSLAKQLLYALQEEEQNTGSEFDLATGTKNHITVNTASDWTINNNVIANSMMTANSVDSDQYVDGSIDLAHMSSESVDEDNLHISNAGSNGQFLQNQSGYTGGLTWATAAGTYSHPNHSGEVTSSGDGATTIADNVVDEANLKISNAGSNGDILQKQSGNTGGLTWVPMSTAQGPLRGFETVKYTGAEQAIPKNAWTDVTDLSITYTPTLSRSIIVLEDHFCLYVRAQDQSSGTVWSDCEQQFIVTPTGGSAATVQEFQAISTGAGTEGATGNVSYGAALRAKWNFYEEYTNSNTTEKTFKVQLKRNGNGTLKVNNQEGHSYFTLKEYTT